MASSLWRISRVLEARGIRRTQHYYDIQNGLFTRPVKLGERASAWPESEVAALNQARIAGKSNDEIRQLVAELEAARTAGAGA
jgi:prophage regulatory protein